MNVQKILKCAIVFYIRRHRFFFCLFFFFFWYWCNKKSRNSSSLIIKEKNNKKGGWFNWLFQTFKTIIVAIVRSATKFPRALRITEPIFTCHCRSYIKSKLAYAVYCTFSSNIIKYMSFECICRFILYYICMQCIRFSFLSITKWPKRGTYSKQGKRIFATFANAPSIK